MQTIVQDLLSEIRESVPSSSHMHVLMMSDLGFTIQVGRSPDATITVTLQDSSRSTFAVTYPGLEESRDGGETVVERTAEGILASAVSWMVRKVFRYGFVPPEGYWRPPQNGGKPQSPQSEQ